MKKFLTITVLIFAQPLFAASELSSAIKNQEEIEKSTRIENSLSAKEIHSAVNQRRDETFSVPQEKTCFKIAQLQVEENGVRASVIEKLTRSVQGKCVGAQGIVSLASQLQDAVINAGFVTSRVQIPNQNLSTGVLRLRIIAGKISAIKIEGSKIYPWILPFKKDDILNLRDIEQGLEVLQRVPGSVAKINIKASTQPDYSDIELHVENKKSWNLRTWVNNWGDKGTGKYLTGGAVYLYDLGGVNDLFYLSGTTSIERSKTKQYQSYSAWYSVPWGYWDYDFFYSRSLSRQGIEILNLGLVYAGVNEYYSAKATRTLYRDQRHKLAASMELNKRNAGYHLADVELLSQKRELTNLRFGLNYKQNLEGARLDSRLYYQRFVPWLGAERTPDMLSGDVSPHSHIFSAEVEYVGLLNPSWMNGWYNLQAGGQYSPQGLTLQDRIALSSRWKVRGFENSAQLTSNNGYYLQSNLNLKTPVPAMVWYGGADWGQLRDEIYPVKQYRGRTLMSATSGVKGNVSAFSYDISVSKPLLHPDNLQVDKLTSSFTLSYQF